MSCLVIAEIGINHNGSLETVQKLMDAASFAGCDGVKFQKRTIDLVYSQKELDKERESPWGNTNRQQKEGLEFRTTEYQAINNYATLKNLIWFGSPWDYESVEFLAEFNPPFIKIASALITDFHILGAIKETGIPVILSTGMSTKKEVSEAVMYLGSSLVYILACTSTYPTKSEEINLGFITTLKKEFPKYKIGFSNHSPGIVFILGAATLGAEMIEFHITLDRTMYGSDQASSIEPFGMLRLVRNIKAIQQGIGTGEWVVFPSEEIIKQKLRKN